MLENPLMLAVSGVAGAAVIALIRWLTRTPAAIDEAIDFVVFAGTESACLEWIDQLADAGVPAWLRSSAASSRTTGPVPGGATHEVCVDQQHADAIPELLRRADEVPIAEPDAAVLNDAAYQLADPLNAEPSATPLQPVKSTTPIASAEQNRASSHPTAAPPTKVGYADFGQHGDFGQPKR